MTKVTIDVPLAAAAETFIQLWDNAAPTPGTTTPRVVLPIPRVALMGLRRRISYIFPGGLVFGTALSWEPTTTYNGSTIPVGADLPLAIAVYFEKLTG